MLAISLRRDLVKQGYYCDVVALSNISNPRGRAVKTGCIDEARPAQFYAHDLLVSRAII